MCNKEKIIPDNRSVCPYCGDVYGEEWSHTCSCGRCTDGQKDKD